MTKPEGLEKVEALLSSWSRFKSGIRVLIRTVLWFAMPFGVLWAFDVPVETAVRLAVGPALCMGTMGIAAFFCFGFVLHAIAAMAKIAEPDSKHH